MTLLLAAQIVVLSLTVTNKIVPAHGEWVPYNVLPQLAEERTNLVLRTTYGTVDCQLSVTNTSKILTIHHADGSYEELPEIHCILTSSTNVVGYKDEALTPP